MYLFRSRFQPRENIKMYQLTPWGVFFVSPAPGFCEAVLALSAVPNRAKTIPGRYDEVYQRRKTGVNSVFMITEEYGTPLLAFRCRTETCEEENAV